MTRRSSSRPAKEAAEQLQGLFEADVKEGAELASVEETPP